MTDPTRQTVEERLRLALDRERESVREVMVYLKAAQEANSRIKSAIAKPKTGDTTEVELWSDVVEDNLLAIGEVFSDLNEGPTL